MRPLGAFFHRIPSGHVPPEMFERTASSDSPVSSQNLLMRTHLFTSVYRHILKNFRLTALSDLDS